jgi:hypothetical protein
MGLFNQICARSRAPESKIVLIPGKGRHGSVLIQSFAQELVKIGELPIGEVGSLARLARWLRLARLAR